MAVRHMDLTRRFTAAAATTCLNESLRRLEGRTGVRRGVHLDGKAGGQIRPCGEVTFTAITRVKEKTVG
jgi:hypothetical protein